MTIYKACTSCTAVLLLALIGNSVWAEDLEEIRFGESALTFAAGSILKSSPQDGVVNVVTGDNQTSGDRMELGQRDTLYLKLTNPGDVAVGDLFTIYKRARKVFHPVTREYLGFLVIRLAIVEVVQVDKALTTVQAVRAYGAISPGDPVMKFAMPAEPESNTAPSDDMTGMIVELQSDMGMTLVAQRNVVYVDRGRADGLRVGDLMDVIRSGGNLPPRMVGEIKILSTQDRTATALITKSTARVLRGDRFRMKSQTAEVVPVSVPAAQQSQSRQPSESAPPANESVSGKITSQPVSRQMTTITLNDLMKQLRYESGEATIRPEGYKVLDELINYLKGAPADQLIRVEGHADTMEIGPSLKSRYATNWDLSKARASGVLRYLVEKGGIDSARLSSVGYGDTKPVVSNATEPGRQRNRRVDIVLYTPEPENGAGTSERTTKSIPRDSEYKVSNLTPGGQPAAIAPMLESQSVSTPVPTTEPASTPVDQSSAMMPAAPAGEAAGADQKSDQTLSSPR
ncbi:MAG TPA: OmpA family protein [Nitrospira sp.]